MRRASSGMTPALGAANYLTSFALPALAGVISDRAFGPNSTAVLEANTRCWFVLGTVSDDSAGNPRNFLWEFSGANGPITGPGTVPNQFAETGDGRDAWGVSPGTPFLLRRAAR